ncbi:MAG: hypothetical protein AB8B56_19925 [Crocinitomicaceae bacterium]
MKYLPFTLLILAMSLVNCSDDDSTDFYNNTDYRNAYLNEYKEIFTIVNPSVKNEIISKKGVKIEFDKNTFLKENSLFTGNIRVEFLLIVDKSNMILSGLTTVLRSNSQLDILKTGGEFYLNAFDAETNEKLTLSDDYLVSIPKALTEDDGSTMLLFIGSGENIQYWRWPLFQGDTSSVIDESDSAFNVIFSEFGWINCDAFALIDKPKFAIAFEFPDNFNDDNALTFISLDSLPFSMLNIYTPIPINENAKLIFITRTENNYHVAFEEFVSQENVSIDFTDKELDVVPADEIKNYLKNIVE